MTTEVETVSESDSVCELSSEEIAAVSGGHVMEVRILGYVIQARAGAWAVWDKSQPGAPVAWGEA